MPTTAAINNQAERTFSLAPFLRTALLVATLLLGSCNRIGLHWAVCGSLQRAYFRSEYRGSKQPLLLLLTENVFSQFIMQLWNKKNDQDAGLH